MRKVQDFAPIKTKDIADIMYVINAEQALSPVAYKRLHYYVVTLERMLEETLHVVRQMPGTIPNAERRVRCN